MTDKKVSLGSPLFLSDKELDELSQVTEEDIKQALKFWRENAPDEFIDLLDAQKVDE